MLILVLRWICTIILAFLLGQLLSKIKLPAILGWLIAGMILGPYALKLLPQELIDLQGYTIIIHVLECMVGLMIGTELVWKRLKKYGKALIITTLTQSLGTFFVVTAVFAIVFWITRVPIYLAAIFGGIALATAPAPALSIVREFHTKGPVTKTLIPMAALDDIVGAAVFFTTIAIVARHISGGGLPIWMIPVMILLPLLIGVITGIPTGLLLKKCHKGWQHLCIFFIAIIITTALGILCNSMLLSPLLNFMLMGMAFSASFANIVSEEELEKIMQEFQSFLGIAMIIVIINLGAPLDYHAIMGAGAYTFIYIVTRGLGKYFGARFGAKLTGLPVSVQKYLGFTLLPHSGVSLVFTGIASSTLATVAPECAAIITGTIAAAAVLNEIIAVIMAKKGFEWALEMQKE